MNEEVRKVDPKSADIVRWMKSRAVPSKVAIVVSDGTVVWIGAANLLPDTLPWPSPLYINVDPMTYDIVKARAAEIEKGIKVDG